jgi:E3 ubiquitin-protein ligase HUWE1
MIKIVINSPHLLDFENKRALFRAEVKRIKKKSSSNRIIYMNLDRKEVFQQSFNNIMNKKPEDLKNRIKVNFEGEEGEDVGGLTR